MLSIKYLRILGRSIVGDDENSDVEESVLGDETSSDSESDCSTEYSHSDTGSELPGSVSENKDNESITFDTEDHQDLVTLWLSSASSSSDSNRPIPDDLGGAANEDSRPGVCRSPAMLDLSPIENVDWSTSLSNMQEYFGGSPEPTHGGTFSFSPAPSPSASPPLVLTSMGTFLEVARGEAEVSSLAPKTHQSESRKRSIGFRRPTNPKREKETLQGRKLTALSTRRRAVRGRAKPRPQQIRQLPDSVPVAAGERTGWRSALHATGNGTFQAKSSSDVIDKSGNNDATKRDEARSLEKITDYIEEIEGKSVDTKAMEQKLKELKEKKEASYKAQQE
ncbi:hypothetical protein FOL47_010324, partial [Perkinsus chesapeaki]